MTIGTIQGGSSQLYAHQVALAAARTAESQAQAALAQATALKQVMLTAGPVDVRS
jgi:hypothetical protein